MKNIIKYTVAGLLAAFCITGCSDWVTPERVVIQNPEEQSPVLRDNAYYEALRAYKQTKHKLAFGWYGSWTAVGASYQTRLQSAPDSMDIISIWSQWHSLTPEQIADKEAVQKIKGTKVIFTIFLNNLPDEFKIDGQTTDEGIENFARSYCRDSINKYNYDGIDIDYEPGYGASGEFVGHNNEQFKKLITAMSKYVGPKSGTGKLFTIDGVPYAVHTECAELFDYGIVQAYQSTSYWDLQSRFDEAAAKGWKPEQYIFTENFESYWKTGGVDHSTAEGETVNSLLGMARFNPSQGFCAGFGSYHMEYEYAQSSMPYKYMRKAIQDVNPAGGAIKVKLSSSWYQTKTFLIEDDGSLTGSNDAAFSVGFARPISRDITFNVKVDNSLVAAYNKENGTAYQTLDPSEVTVTPLTAAAESFTSEENKITFSTKSLKKGKYLIPVTVEVPDSWWIKISYSTSSSMLPMSISMSMPPRLPVSRSSRQTTGTSTATSSTILTEATEYGMKMHHRCSTESSIQAGTHTVTTTHGATEETSLSKWTRSTKYPVCAGISCTMVMPIRNASMSSTAMTEQTGNLLSQALLSLRTSTQMRLQQTRVTSASSSGNLSRPNISE